MDILLTNKQKIAQFSLIFKNLKNISTDVEMHVSEKGIYIQGMDAGHVCLFEVEIKEYWFDEFNNDTKWTSMSMGKSLVSYLTGHAICGGYIDSIDTTLNDWPLIKDTLYSKKKLIDILNMAAGDQKYVDDQTGLKKTGRWYNSHSIFSFANKELKNSEPTNSKKYYYNGLATNIIMNYVIFKTNKDTYL